MNKPKFTNPVLRAVLAQQWEQTAVTAQIQALIGSTGRYTQAERRLLEAQFARQTRAKIIDLGLWPKNLPMWPEGPE